MMHVLIKHIAVNYEKEHKFIVRRGMVVDNSEPFSIHVVYAGTSFLAALWVYYSHVVDGADYVRIERLMKWVESV